MAKLGETNPIQIIEFIASSAASLLMLMQTI